MRVSASKRTGTTKTQIQVTHIHAALVRYHERNKVVTLHVEAVRTCVFSKAIAIGVAAAATTWGYGRDRSLALSSDFSRA
jgi:hypothetical protein